MLIYKWNVQNNTLVNDDGRAMLTDFGLAKVIEELAGPTGNTTSMCAVASPGVDMRHNI